MDDDLVDVTMLENAQRALRSEAARGASEALLIERRSVVDVCSETGLRPLDVMRSLGGEP